jgi:hypothetical protein
MTQTRREREDFLIRMDREGVPLDVARKLLRYGATLQRLAEAQCNGDWPADNGTKERKVVPCTRCEALWVRSSMVADKTQPAVNGYRPLICKDCRTNDLVTVALAPYGLKPFFGGDPRGAVLSIVKADVPREAFESGREHGICVPA